MSAAAAPASAPPPGPGLAEGARLGLTVIIAMPSAAGFSTHSHRRSESSDTIEQEKGESFSVYMVSKTVLMAGVVGKQKAGPLEDDGEGEIPEVVFGVADVSVKQEVGTSHERH